MLTALFAAFVWAMVCLFFDAYLTDKGIRAGVAVEGSDFIKFFARTSKPTFAQLYLIDGVLRTTFLGAGFIPGPVEYPATFQALATAVLVVSGLKSVQGARQWQWMFKNPGKPLPEMNTVWQKICGFWG